MQYSLLYCYNALVINNPALFFMPRTRRDAPRPSLEVFEMRVFLMSISSIRLLAALSQMHYITP